MPVKFVRLGPGTLKLGTAPGTDFSCQVQSMGLNVDKDAADALTVLCGDVVPGSITYSYVLAGTLLQDLVTSGLAEYTWLNAGKTVAFEYVPTTNATGFKITGNIVVDPMALGTSDGEYGDTMTSDVEWTCTAKPTVTFASAITPYGAVDDTRNVPGPDDEADVEPEPVGAST